MRDLPGAFIGPSLAVIRDRISLVLNSGTMQGYERNKKGPTRPGAPSLATFLLTQLMETVYSRNLNLRANIRRS